MRLTPMRRRTYRGVASLGAAGLLAAAAVTSTGPATATAPRAHSGTGAYHHVLLLSVDGMHQSDLRWYIARHPHSALASLVHSGTDFTRARTPFPSDSFPGLVGQVTGGNPKTTGIFYDVTYNHRLLDPSASARAVPTRADCAKATPGANVAFDESLDRNPDRLDAGQGLAHQRADILQMTRNPQRLIDPRKLPINPVTCTRVYPHQYLRVNTIFDVARHHGLRTAWSDKHPAYEILDGRSGNAVQDLFTPEINSLADKQGDDWTNVNSFTQRYDHVKVKAVLNEIAGYDHSGSTRLGTPAIFGMNFQSVSTAEKLPTSDGRLGGYLHHGTIPSPVLRSSLNFVDSEIGAMVRSLKRHGKYRHTAIIVSSKHGQSPRQRGALTRIDDSTVVDQLNSAWQRAHPAAVQPLVAASLNDDGMLLWFSDGDRTPRADTFASRFLLRYHGNGTGNDGRAAATDIRTHPKAYTRAGLRTIKAGVAAAHLLGTSKPGPRTPDLIGLVQHGTVYTDKTSKIAEHGGDDPQDRHVPLVVAAPGSPHAVRRGRVETTQVAPTVLSLLGLRPRALRAVRAEGTRTLHLG